MKVAVELHGEGFTQVAIAQRLGCTPDRVAQLLREAGVPPRKYSKGAA